MSAPPKFQQLAGNHLLHKYKAWSHSKTARLEKIWLLQNLKRVRDLNPTRFGHPGSTHALAGLRAASDNANLKQFKHSKKWYVCEASMEAESNTWGETNALNRVKNANRRISWKGWYACNLKERTAKVFLKGTRRLECRAKDANDAMEECIMVKSRLRKFEKKVPKFQRQVMDAMRLRTEPGNPHLRKSLGVEKDGQLKPTTQHALPCHREFQPNVWLGNLKNRLHTKKRRRLACEHHPWVWRASSAAHRLPSPRAIRAIHKIPQVSDDMQKASVWGMCASFRGAFRLSLCPYPPYPYKYNPSRTSIGSKLISHSTDTADLAERSSITSDRFFNFHAFEYLKVSMRQVYEVLPGQNL